MAIEILKPKDLAEWLVLRPHTVGPSEAATLLGPNRWKSPAQLWAEKSGYVLPIAENPAMRRARSPEAVAIEVLREEKPTWIIMIGGRSFRRSDS